MTINGFKRLLNWWNDYLPFISLIGGEPTLHSKFREIVQLVLSSGRKVILMTNLIMEREVLSWLLDQEITLGINVDSPRLNNGNYSDIFDQNINHLLKKAPDSYITGKNHISLSSTISSNTQLTEELFEILKRD